ncbi:MAG: M4 family metallopeptidase [Bacteroidia bacterium]|nr:M4 family metallopeptidase [Bacteroidia bacterium]
MNMGTSYGNAVDFTDNDNYWNNINAQQDEVATDAHWGTEMTYDYYYYQHGRNSIDNSGYLLINYVHYQINYNNAFWNGQWMTYGDGDGINFTPLISIDVVGHEITHGLISFTANLNYSYSSGALNESFCDIFGNAIEFYAKTGNWRLGEDITSNGLGIRNMANPNEFNNPDTYAGTYWYSGSDDYGGVHTNSGVQNYWFYLLSEGGTGTNDNGDDYSITGIGIDKAAAIAYRALTVYLFPAANYYDSRYWAIEAAMDIYGPCSDEVEQTIAAWNAVGVYGVTQYHYDYINYTAVASATWKPGNNPFNNSETVYIQNALTIQSGTYLTIKDMRFEFGPDAKVIIERGAKLTLDNTTFTSYCAIAKWHGIEVWGTTTESQYTSGTQGYLYVSNNSVIEYAVIAAIAGKYLTDDNLDDNYYGGIIQARSSTFRNNAWGIRLMKYHNFFPAQPGSIVKNLSYVALCNFISEGSDDNRVISFIYLMDVEGIIITGNNSQIYCLASHARKRIW